MFCRKKRTKRRENQLRDDCDVILRAEKGLALRNVPQTAKLKNEHSSPTGYCPSIGIFSLYVAGQNTVGAPAGLAGHS